MKKVCGLGLICLSMGLLLSFFLTGFMIKSFFILAGAVIGYLLMFTL